MAMMHSRTMNKENRIHERVFRIVYQDDTSTFKELFNMYNSVKIYTRNLQILSNKMFKVKNRIAPTLLEEAFRIAYPNYNLRKKREFKS